VLVEEAATFVAAKQRAATVEISEAAEQRVTTVEISEVDTPLHLYPAVPALVETSPVPERGLDLSNLGLAVSLVVLQEVLQETYPTLHPDPA
jgi:hypothetical protein